MHVNVGGFHDPQMGLAGLGPGRERMQGDEAGGGADKLAAI